MVVSNPEVIFDWASDTPPVARSRKRPLRKSRTGLWGRPSACAGLQPRMLCLVTGRIGPHVVKSPATAARPFSFPWMAP